MIATIQCVRTRMGQCYSGAPTAELVTLWVEASNALIVWAAVRRPLSSAPAPTLPTVLVPTRKARAISRRARRLAVGADLGRLCLLVERRASGGCTSRPSPAAARGVAVPAFTAAVARTEAEEEPVVRLSPGRLRAVSAPTLPPAQRRVANAFSTVEESSAPSAPTSSE